MTHIRKMLETVLRGIADGPTKTHRAEARELLAHLQTYKPAPDSKVVRFADPQPRRRKKETK